MGWRPWELERIAHPQDFRDAVVGYQWRLNWDLDCAAFVAYHVLIAFGGSERKDGTTLTLSDMLGRDLFNSLVPPSEPDEATREEREMEEAEREGKAERTKMLIWAAMKARQAKDRGEDPEPWRG
jgi:hypothetical protein